MINIALYQPKIPGNTGSIIRFSANTGIKLHLIHPLGFAWEDKQLRRAGLDYAEYADVTHYDNWIDFLAKTNSARKFIITTKGSAIAHETEFKSDDFLIFGSEDAGIAEDDMIDIPEENWLRIPMKSTSRSMNLSNTVAMMGFEALRQLGFQDLE